MTQTLNDFRLPYTETSMTLTYFTQKIVHYMKSFFSHSRQSYRDKNPKKMDKNDKPNNICTKTISHTLQKTLHLLYTIATSL